MTPLTTITNVQVEADLVRARAFSLAVQGVDAKTGVSELVRFSAKNPSVLARAHRRLTISAAASPDSRHVGDAITLLADAWLVSVKR